MVFVYMLTGKKYTIKIFNNVVYEFVLLIIINYIN